METFHLSNRICNTCLHASCVASTFDFADCSKKRDQCDIPLIATFFPRITKKLSQMKSKPKMSRFLWCLTLNHLIMIQMNKRRRGTFVNMDQIERANKLCSSCFVWLFLRKCNKWSITVMPLTQRVAFPRPSLLRKQTTNSVKTVLMELWITPGWWNWSENTCKFYGTRHSLMRQIFFPFLSMHSTNLLLSNMPIFASWWKAMVRTFWELSLDQ